jgi:hypothetical protein
MRSYNMQTEADPQVISLLMERAGYGDIASTVINVAGHRCVVLLLMLVLIWHSLLLWAEIEC